MFDTIIKSSDKSRVISDISFEIKMVAKSPLNPYETEIFKRISISALPECMLTIIRYAKTDWQKTKMEVCISSGQHFSSFAKIVENDYDLMELIMATCNYAHKLFKIYNK